MMRVIVLLVLLVMGLCAVAGADAMPAHSTVQIECCVVSGVSVAPVQLWPPSIGIVVLSLAPLLLGFDAIHRRLILSLAFASAASAPVHLRFLAIGHFSPWNRFH